MIAPALRAFSPSRIALRLLAFNVLVVFTPVLGVLYLDVYESHLRQAQEDSMVQQARTLAAAIATEPADRALDPERLTALFENFGGRTDARLRVYDPSGALVADSRRCRQGSAMGAARKDRRGGG